MQISILAVQIIMIHHQILAAPVTHPARLAQEVFKIIV
jgi:hypothetical protein